MHKKVPCPRCKAKGYVYSPQTTFRSRSLSYGLVVVPCTSLDKVVCPDCGGHKYYAVPVTGYDLVRNMSPFQASEVLANEAFKTINQSLVHTIGVVLNEDQKNFLREKLVKRFYKILEESADISDSLWGDLSDVVDKDWILSLEENFHKKVSLEDS